ncbi:MAG: long-chain-fatty-acid--CoA ligase [Syntrophomonadaceae bacterium]|jgi:acyl-CoA synthetase (AMP-forming)/AMP-acid ligase II|nr:long-chain-fatty-acid--CoA ligase [Syntrophomonadaceae bacterium]
MNVAEMLYRNARKYPDKEAIVFKELRLNYREVDHLSNQFANALINLGIKKGDKVAMMMRNSEKYAAVYFGILKAGAVVVPINISLLKNEVQFIVNNCEAKAFVFDHVFWPVLNGIEKELPLVKDFICTAEVEGQNFRSYQELLDVSPIEAPPVTINEEDLCSIIYTSGTTGTPRGAVFKHKNVVATVVNTGALAHRMNSYTRNLAMMPLFHSAPLHLYFLGAVYVGGTNVLMEGFDPKGFLETIQNEKTTHFFGPAVVYLTCAKLLPIDKYDLSSMEMFVLGGSPISKEDIFLILDAFKLRGKNKLQQVYGFTEAGPSGLGLYPEEIEVKTSSIGCAGNIGTETVIFAENGEKAKIGEVGEIGVRSEGIMVEYYKDPEKTANTIKNGWVMSGDLARYDEDGYIYFVDRSKDMIITGGQNVYSKEVEDVIMQHPSVMMTAVIAVPHPEWGESVKAVVSLKPNCSAAEEEIIAFCQDRLAKFKVPRYVQIVEDIPHNPAGKILKTEVRKLYGKS